MNVLRPPAGTSLRFALLILLVGASGLFIFYQLFFLAPVSHNYFFSVFGRCFADPRIALPDTYETGRSLLIECQAPAFYAKLKWIGSGFLVLISSTAVLYLLHPVRTTLWNGWVRYEPSAYNAHVLTHLQELVDQMGLRRAPQWYVAGRGSASAGGSVFGLPRRRRIRLDAALVRDLHDNPDTFDATVLHELAHLRNRDVDLTQVTIALWWAFVAVVAMPLFVLAAFSATDSFDRSAAASELTAHLVDRPLLVTETLVLTALVFLTRNSVLRARELHADATAAQHDGADEVVLRRLYPKRSRGRLGRWTGFVQLLGTHPMPAARIAARKHPHLVWRPSLVQLWAAGLALGLLAANLDQLVQQLFLDVLGRINTFQGVALTGTGIGALSTTVLLISLWQSRGPTVDCRVSPRACALQPIVLVTGLVAGLAVPLLTYHLRSTPHVWASSRWWNGDFTPLILSAIPLTIGLILLALWFRSAIEPASSSRRRTLGLLVAGAVIASPWFAAWYVSADWRREEQTAGLGCWWDGISTAQFGQALRCPPAFPVLNLVEINPLTLLGIVLVFLVPLGPRASQRGHVAAGTIAGLSVVGFGICLAFWAQDAVPASDRRIGTPAGDAFLDTFWHAYLTAAVALQVVAALAVLVRSRAFRMRGAVLAASIAAIIGTVGQLATWATARCIDLWGTNPASCVPPLSMPRLAADLHTVMLYGCLACVPIVTLAALRRPLVGKPNHLPARTIAGDIVVAGVVIVVLVAVIANLPTAERVWVRWGA
ncbi:M48 family metalloprotease [Nocardia sp. bgisy118]|uniref:M48 family metalloprotease n=1 Tax=Nocardia sp. bgisy118 TaxID=3413786 RepID=UPI003F4A7E03